MHLAKLTKGMRTITVCVSGRAQFAERFVRAAHGEQAGEFVTFETEAQARHALGPDLAAPETFEWVRKFLDDEISCEQFMAGRGVLGPVEVCDRRQSNELLPAELAKWLDSGPAMAPRWEDAEPSEPVQARVVQDMARELLVGKVLATGELFEANNARDLAEQLFAAGVRDGRVSMPDWREGDIAPFTGDKIELNFRLNQLGRETGPDDTP